MATPKPKTDLPKVNYYETLGVEKTASMQEITTAYRKLALKFHPDRNRGAKLEEATEKFKTVSEAYATLGDVSKRRHYDLHGTGGMEEKVGLEAVEVENVGWLGRFLAAQVAKLGVPIPTSVSAEVLGQAKQLSQQAKSSSMQAASSAAPLASPRILKAGEIVEGKLNLSCAEFFYVQVTEDMAANGFVLACRTRRKNDRFRMLVFDARGDVAHQGESAPSESAKGPISRCRLFLAPFETMSVGAPFPSLDETPPICHSLDTLEERGPSALKPGSHLVACYCDNFLSSIQFTLGAVPLESPEKGSSSDRLAKMAQVAEELRAKKTSLNELAETIVTKREALIKAQEEYKSAMESAKNEEPLVADLLRRHAELQQEAVAASMPTTTTLANQSPATRRPSQSSDNEGGIGGFFSRLARPDSSAASGGGYPSSMTL